MSFEPQITVCITSYNHEDYVRQAIDSVLNQIYRNFEIFVYDDCSTDRTTEYLKSFGDNIHLIRHDRNRGSEAVHQTINEAIASAKGDYFFRMDSDDFIETDYFERMINECRKNMSYDWICGGLNIVNKDGNKLLQWHYDDWKTDPDNALYRCWEYCSVAMPHNGLFKTKFLQDNKLAFKPFDYGGGADIWFTIQGMLCQPSVKIISGVGLNWRVHGDNNSCNIVWQVERILAIKKYFAEHIDDTIYLKHPLLKQYKTGTDDYKAAKYFLLADNLYTAKKEFHIPELFKRPNCEEETELNLWRFDNAIREFAERSLKYSPRFENEITELLIRLESDSKVVEGQKLLRLGNFGKAQTKFHKALAIHPKSTGALRGLSESSFSSGAAAAAEKFCLQALQLDPDDAGTLNIAGVLLYAQGKLTESASAFEKALSSDPHMADAHTNVLELYGAMAPKTVLDVHQSSAIIRSARWTSKNCVDESRLELMKENHSLRDHAFQQFENCYHRSGQRVLLHRPDNGAIKYLFDSWAETLNIMGLQTLFLNWDENSSEKFQSFQPTVFITVGDPAYIDKLELDFIADYQQQHDLKIGHVTNLQDSYDLCDFLITFHLDPARDIRFDSLAKPLVSVPFGINPNQHYMRPARQVWDFFFVGTNSQLKIEQSNRYLLPIVDSYRGILAGLGWNRGSGEISVSDSALLYNFAKVLPNFHLESQYERFDEVNERTFIIPACGGFELVDNPAAIKELFDVNEMSVANSPQEYKEMFEHFLNNPNERLPYIQNGMSKVWSKYTLFHSLSKLAEYLNINETAIQGTQNCLISLESQSK